MLAVAAYLVIAGYIVRLSRNQINPDAVAYVQVARHYASGRWDLAVNSWWGPLLSWLLIPAVWMEIEPLLVVKIFGILFGLGFALAVASLVGKMNDNEGRFLGFLAALMLALTMLPSPVTPDLLLTCLLTWYFSLSIGLLERARASRAFAMGLLGGVAYLTKAYALPFVTVHLCLTFIMKRLLVRRGLAQGRALKPFVAALAGMLIVALPWIVVISEHDGTLTFSSVARFSRAYSPIGVRRARPAAQIHRPRAGRITSHENQVEVREGQSVWSPFKDVRGIKYQLVTIFRNAILALGHLKAADSFGILMCGLLVSVLLLFPLRRSFLAKEGILMLWASVSVGAYLGGYILTVVSQRYLWPVWGLLLGLSVHALGRLHRNRHPRGSDDHARQNRGPIGPRSAPFRPAIAFLLLISIGYNTLLTIEDWRSYKRVEPDWLRKSA
ncbi:glycosyltransferase family 39 protein, partial [bacterium]|nr:glycosyltransferase family 39 protein [bacterium]